ncbi:hypothetical protein MASR1M107_00790 [Ignavibacteriales bacterium]
MKLKSVKKFYRPITVISSDVIIRGEIEGACDMRFDGKLRGDIRVDGLLLIGKGAEVTGNLVAESISIAGKVTGNAYATDKVEINPSGELSGDIRSKSLVIEEGGIYKGKVEDGMTGRETKADETEESKDESADA